MAIIAKHEIFATQPPVVLLRMNSGFGSASANDGDSTAFSREHAAFRNLTRNTRERCVMARVQRTGLRFYRCFSVRRHGSWEAAEAAARLWLRPVLACLASRPPEDERPPGARNRSGVVGVFFQARNRVLRSGRVAAYPAYASRWPGAKTAVTWMFTSNGGEEGAFLRAVLCRELKTADRLRVEWAVQSLSPARREELLSRRRLSTGSRGASESVLGEENLLDGSMECSAVSSNAVFSGVFQVSE